MKKIHNVFLAVLAFALFSCPVFAQEFPEMERIKSFDAMIQVNSDGIIDVKETLKVHAAGDQIKRGIYREFPVVYRDDYGLEKHVSFEVVEVLRDGQPEDYHTEQKMNSLRIYMGKKNYLLPTGDYVYDIHYRAKDQLRFFPDHDELYWNVTGNDWKFPIEQVHVTVVPPSGVGEGLQVTAYTGESGSKDQNAQWDVTTEKKILFETKQELLPGEGLTIAVGWPKGFVPEPTPKEKLNKRIRDNIGFLSIIVGFFVVVAYYLIAWSLVGRDPEKGVIIPQYEAPYGYTAAAVRRAVRGRMDNKTFATALVQLAVGGHIKIIEKDKKKYTLQKRSGKSTLSPEEASLMKKLFGEKDVLELHGKYNSKLGAAYYSLWRMMEKIQDKQFIVSNYRYFVVGVLLSMAFFIAFLWMRGPVYLAVLFPLVWLSIWTVGVSVLLKRVVKTWREAIVDRQFLLIIPALFLTAFSVPFIGAEFFVLYLLSRFTDVFTAGTVFALAFVHVIFFFLLKAPTKWGREFLDKVEGLKMYLTIGEKDRLAAMKSLPHSLETYEKLLPYAMALNVEDEWSEQFGDVLQKSMQEAEENGWYSGRSLRSPMIFASSLASGLGSAIGSSSMSRSSRGGGSSSSSGFSSSGSSGGGGGSSGGGGW